MDNETSTQHHHVTTSNATATMSLVEKLRNQPWTRKHWKRGLNIAERLQHREEEARQKLDLLFQHKSEFPASIRPRIDQVWSAANQKVQSHERYLSIERLDMVDMAVHEFFLGTSQVGVSHPDCSASLNSAVDTEEEVEAVIRMFPMLIRNPTQSLATLFYRHPLLMMVKEPQARPFIPLYVKVIMNIIGNEMDEKSLLLHSIKYRFRTAIQIILSNSEHDLETKDSASLLAIRALLGTVYFDQEHFVAEDELFNMVTPLASRVTREKQLAQGMVAGKPTHNYISFVEGRIRFLIEWRPSLLRVCSTKPNRVTFLEMFSYNVRNVWRFMDKDAAFRIFEVIVELGLTYFPGDLGFVFYSDCFRKCCTTFGHQEVRNIVQEKLVRFIGTNNNNNNNNTSNRQSLSQLVFEAAASGEISMDGVYTLVRMNPVAALAYIDGLQDRMRQLEIGFFEAHALAREEGVEDRLQHLENGFFKARKQSNR